MSLNLSFDGDLALLEFDHGKANEMGTAQLAAFAEGYGAKWSSGGLTTHPETYAAVGIDPEQEEIVGFIWVGVPARVPKIKRPELAAHLTALP